MKGKAKWQTCWEVTWRENGAWNWLHLFLVPMSQNLFWWRSLQYLCWWGPKMLTCCIGFWCLGLIPGSLNYRQEFYLHLLPWKTLNGLIQAAPNNEHPVHLFWFALLFFFFFSIQFCGVVDMVSFHKMI